LREKKEAMDIVARLSFISQEILNIENNRLELEQILGVMLSLINHLVNL
jgi:hypothetical protein